MRKVELLPTRDCQVGYGPARGRATPKSYLYIKHVKTTIGPEIKQFQVAKCKIFIGLLINLD